MEHAGWTEMLLPGEFPYQLFKPLSQSLRVVFWSVCIVPKERDVISGHFQGIEHRLSEENVAASCTCLSSRAACFVSPWSQAVAHWYWERTGVPRVTAEHGFCEMTQWDLKTSQTTTTKKPYAEKATEKDQTTVRCVIDKNTKCGCSHSQPQEN